MNKFYVIRTTSSGVMYKKYKCIDGWSRTKDGCWQFSKQGAVKIANRLNELCGYGNQPYPKKEHYSIMEA